MPYLTERIWHYHPGDTLGPREGAISIHPASCPDANPETASPLHITSGLHPRDIAVFLELIEEPSTHPEPTEVGYMVTDVQPDGSGTLVHGDVMDLDPRTWVNERTVHVWRILAKEGYSPADFGLDNLQSFLDDQEKSA